MRSVVVAAMVLGSVGCSSQGQLQYQSSIHTEARGAAFESDDSLQAGMIGNTCQVDVASGLVGNDVDVAEGEDEVQDTRFGQILVIGTDGVHIHEGGAWGNGSYTPDYPGSDVIAGRFIDDGVAAVRVAPSGLVVTWHGDASGQAVVPGAALGAAIAADPATGAVLIADGTVVSATPGELVAIGEGDLVAWDATVGVAYVAMSGESRLSAVRLDGSVEWSVALEGEIVSLSHLGAQGAAIVSASVGDAGRLIVVDGRTGAVRLSEPTPGTASAITTSPEGGTVALAVRRNGPETMLFHIDL